MKDANCQKVKEVFRSAIMIMPEERSAFLDDICCGDVSLRSEVTSLLLSFDNAENFMEMPAVVEVAESSDAEIPQFESGQKVNFYTIIEQIGKGGMGEVYLAQDSRLDRKVAIKFLSEEFNQDTDKLNRFIQEAKAASALNHPNILTIYEIGKTDEKNYIATEFINGETLRKHLIKNALTLGEIIDIAIQMANALSAAHQAGIIHRDIKPDNVMIREDGIVKILDFGLAKLTEKKINENIAPEATTIGKIDTIPGMIMGTPRYMSPEQAHGESIDERTDIFSFGVVLYEMLAGHLPFEGDSLMEIIVSILKNEPKPLNDAEIPPEIIRIVNKTLEKDKNERYQTTKDLLVILKGVQQQLQFQKQLGRTVSSNKEDAKTQNLKTTKLEEVEKTSIFSERKTPTSNLEQTLAQKQNPNTIQNAIAKPTLSREFIFHKIKTHKLGATFILGGFLIALISFSYWYYASNVDNLNSSSSFFDSIQVSSLTNQGNAHTATVSPDGKLVAFVEVQDTNSKLVVRQISTGGTVDIVPPTSKRFSYRTTFSPDGEYIYYVLGYEGIGILYRVSTLGGKSKELIVDVDSRVTVSPDGKQLAFGRFNPAEGKKTVYLTDNEGKKLRSLIEKDEIGFSNFTEILWSNDGKKLILIGRKKDNESKAEKLSFIAVSTDEKKTVSEVDELKPLSKNNITFGWDFEWFKDNSGIVFLGGKKGDDSAQIWHLDYSNGEVKQLTNDTSNYVSLSVADDMNTIVASKTNHVATMLSHDPKTKQNKQIIGASKSFYGYIGFSQTLDGKILYSKNTDAGINIFSINEDGSNETQLTFETGYYRSPITSPDGKYIVFVSYQKGNATIWRMDSDGNNAVELTEIKDGRDLEPKIASDGKTVIFARYANDNSKIGLMRVSIDGGKAIPLLPESKMLDSSPNISPDGKKIAYFSYSGNMQEKREVDAFLKIYAWDGNEVGQFIAEFDWDFYRSYFEWGLDSKSIIFLMPERKNLSRFSLESKKENLLTSFDSGSIMKFLTSNDGNKIFIVRGTLTSDLILIRRKEKSQ